MKGSMSEAEMAVSWRNQDGYSAHRVPKTRFGKLPTGTITRVHGKVALLGAILSAALFIYPCYFNQVKPIPFSSCGKTGK